MPEAYDWEKDEADYRPAESPPIQPEEVRGMIAKLIELEDLSRRTSRDIKTLKADLLTWARMQAEISGAWQGKLPGVGSVTLVQPSPVWQVVHEGAFAEHVARHMDGDDQGWLVTRVDPLIAEKIIRAAQEDGEKLPGVELIERFSYLRVTVER